MDIRTDTVTRLTGGPDQSLSELNNNDDHAGTPYSVFVLFCQDLQSLMSSFPFLEDYPSFCFLFKGRGMNRSVGR